MLHHNFVLLADKNLHIIKEFPNNTNDSARLCKFINFTLKHNKNINYYRLLWLEKVKFYFSFPFSFHLS